MAGAFEGKLILARGYGYAVKSSEDTRPVQPQSQFRFASLSKPLTAAAIMLLVEDGRLSLDDCVVALLKEDAPKKTEDSRINRSPYAICWSTEVGSLRIPMMTQCSNLGHRVQPILLGIWTVGWSTHPARSTSIRTLGIVSLAVP